MRKVKAAGPVTGAELNAWIREVSGHGPPAAEPDAQPEGGQAPPAPIPNANAGAGANMPGVGVAKMDMNQMIREARFGGRRTWTTHG